MWGFVLIIIGVAIIAYWSPAWARMMNKTVSKEEVAEAETVIAKAELKAAV